MLNRKSSFFIWLVMIVGLLVYGLLYFLITQSWWRTALFEVGLVLGMVLLVLDQRMGWRYYQDLPTASADSLDSSVVTAQDPASDQPAPPIPFSPHLITRSLIFGVCFVPLALFVVTSTGSMIGVGLVLGIGLLLVSEMVQLQDEQAAFNDRFMWQVHRWLSLSEIRWVVSISIVVLALLTIIGLW